MFENIKANHQFKNSIIAALRSGTLSHALILEGGDSKSRFLASKEIAAAVLCESDIKPCTVCKVCKKVENNSHPDIHILKKDEKSNMIKVDPIRELKKQASVLPNDGQKSIFIIENAELMNPQAQNALLKIFEEPSPHLLFILCCGAKSSLLDTIISRATSYSLGEEIIQDENDAKAEKARAIAEELTVCLAEENEVKFLAKIAPLQKDKELFRLTLQSMKFVFRDCIVLQHGGKETLSSSYEAARKLSTKLTARKALEMLRHTEELYDISMMNSNQNLTVTRFSSLLYSVKSH